MGFGGRRGRGRGRSKKADKALGLLENMQHYCETKSTCRREFLAQYFGEQYHPSMCNGLCDHCAMSGHSLRKGPS
ncbi:unnamed protein product [Discosporangium mesarthrocarpum]